MTVSHPCTDTGHALRNISEFILEILSPPLTHTYTHTHTHMLRKGLDHKRQDSCHMHAGIDTDFFLGGGGMVTPVYVCS